MDSGKKAKEGAKITPEMISAGEEAVWQEIPGLAEPWPGFSARDLAVGVYRAMDRACCVRSSSKSPRSPPRSRASGLPRP